MDKQRRYKFIIMYQAVPVKNGKERTIDRQLEKAVKKIAKDFGYRFVGSGYDFTNKRRDIEYEFISLIKRRK